MDRTLSLPGARWVLLFAFGSLAATMGDRGHIAWGVLAYPGGAQPLWVWGLMGSAGVALVSNYLYWPFGRPEAPASLRAAMVPVAWFMGSYLATGPLARWPLALAALLAGTFLARVWHERRELPWSYVTMVAVVGPLVEIAISSSGLFAYLDPDFGVVPIWLPFLYLHVALATRAIGRAFRDSTR